MMKIQYSGVLIAAMSCFAISVAVAQTEAPPAAAPAPAGNTKAGHDTYIRVGCFQCHGTSGQGGGRAGPKLAPEALPFAAFHHQLRRPRALMPIYTDKILSEQQVADIYAYIASIPPAKSPDDIPLLKKK
jgi:mono/diheme cytochrome c family protein